MSETFSQYSFDCGCRFKVSNDKIKSNDGLPSISIDFYNLEHNCQSTWAIFSAGETKGVFQLEKQLGQSWSKKIVPCTLDELSAVISLIRPGTLQAYEDGKNMTQHYTDRKHGREEVKYIHPGLESILKETYGVIGYQEQAMRIASELVGFNLQEADTLRKAMGKKDAALMNKVGENFKIKSAEKKILNEEQTNQIFEWIRAANRYSFNKCLSPDVIVDTPEGTKYLSDIKIGDKVLTPEGTQYNDTTFANVIAIHNTGEQELYQVFLESGKKIESTLEHKFYCTDGYQQYIIPLRDIIQNKWKIATINGFEIILQVISVGLSPTLDIEIDNYSHLYYANGIATSNSHGVAYGDIGYWTAYVKAHFPLHFYTSWLFYAKDKQESQEEVEELVEDLERRGYQVSPPTLKYYKNLLSGFSLLNKKDIYFGISDVKGIGESEIIRLKDSIKEAEQRLSKKIDQVSWWEFLIYFSTSLRKTVVNNLVSVGATDYMNGSLARSSKIFEYNIWSELKEKEQDLCIRNNCKNLEECLNLLVSTKELRIMPVRRTKLEDLLKIIKNSAYSTGDTHYQIVIAEEEFLGVPVTCRRLDTCYAAFDTKCSELTDGKPGKVNIAVEIISVRKHTIKKEGNAKGKVMAFIKVKDDTGSFNGVVAFADKWEEYSDLLYRKNTVLISGKSSKRNDEQNLVIEKVEQI